MDDDGDEKDRERGTRDMTVTYIFQASNREARGLPPVPEPVAPPAFSEGVTPFTRAPRPAADAPAPPAAPGTEPPLVLGQRARAGSPEPARLPPPSGRADPQPGPAPAPESRPVAGAAPAAMPVATHGTSANLPVKWAPADGKLILVAKSRGGVGASSLAVSLAVELLKRGGLFSASARRRVALVDFDVQFGAIGSALDLQDRGGMVAMAQLADEPDAQAVRHTLLTHPSGLRVLPAPQSAIPLDALDRQRVQSIVSALLAEHDFVVAELPPALVDWIEPLLEHAHRVLMVTDLAVPSVARARRAVDLMREDNPDLPVEIVVARERKPLIAGKLQKEAEAALGLPLSHWLPDEPKLARLALDRGEPLVALAPRCGWSRAVHRMALGMDRPVAPVPSKRKG